MSQTPNILEKWGLTIEEFTQLVMDNPSLRGVLIGYSTVEEAKDFADDSVVKRGHVCSESCKNWEVDQSNKPGTLLGTKETVNLPDFRN